MALSPANILVNFISNYAGCHRICYRLQGTIPYTCSSCQPCETNCAGNGSPCSATIPILVDNESCAPQTWEGYVQPCCEDGASLNGRVPFTVTFTPNPDCQSHNILCQSGRVTDIFPTGVNLGGAGYDPTPGATIITIAPPSGPGTQATATPVIDVNGTITSVIITNPGSGYTSVPAVTISCNPATPCPPFYPGYPATLTAVIKCAPINEMGFSCSGANTPSITPGLLVGQNFNICYSTIGPNLPTGYTNTPAGCCFDCVTVTITNNGVIGTPDAKIRYTDCVTKNVITNNTFGPGQTTGPICVVNNSWLIQEADPLNPVCTVVVGSPC